MEGEKKWYESRTVWAGVVAGAVPILAGTLGWDEQTQALVLTNTEAIISGIVGMVAAGVAIYGRLKATKEITPRREK